MGYKYLVIFIFFLLIKVDSVSAQGNHCLQRKVNLNFRETPLRNVLKSIEQQASVVFSYTAKEIDDKQAVTLVVNQESVEKVLRLLFDQNSNIQYSIINQHIILSIKENVTENVRKPLDERVVPVLESPQEKIREVVRTRVQYDTVYHLRYIYDTLFVVDTLKVTDTLVQIDSLVIEHYPDLNDSVFLAFSFIYNQTFQHNDLKPGLGVETSRVDELRDAESIGGYNYSVRGMLDVHLKKAIISTGIGFLKLGENYYYENISFTGGYYNVDTLDDYHSISGNDTSWVYVLDSTLVDYEERKSYVNNPNSYTYLEVPLLVGYQKQFGRVCLSAQTGLSMGLLLKAHGRTLSPVNMSESIPVSKSIMTGYMIYSELHGRVSYAVSKNFYFLSGFSYRRSLTSAYQADFPIKKKIDLFNFNVGFSLRL